MKSIKEFINNFKMAIKSKKNIFITKHKIIFIKIFHYLYLEGFIKNYEIKDIYITDKNESVRKIKKKIILAHLQTSPMNRHIIDIHSSLIGNKQSITYEELLNNNRKDFIILLSTNAGIMTDSEAIKYKKGGILLCVFELQ